MEKPKIFLAICLILVVSGLSAWLYFGAKPIENGSSDDNPQSRTQEQLIVSSDSWNLSKPIVLIVKHVGTMTVTISEIRINNVLNSTSPAWVGKNTLEAGETLYMKVNGSCYFAEGLKQGVRYTFSLITTRGNTFLYLLPIEELRFENVDAVKRNLVIRNIGAVPVMVSKIEVNGEAVHWTATEVYLYSYDASNITVEYQFGAGYDYEIAIITATGYRFVHQFTIRMQEESLFLTKQHVWFNTTGSWAQAAIVIVNTGGKDVVLDRISVRGQESPWGDVYYWRTSNVTISDDLEVTSTNITGSSFHTTIQGATRTFQQASDDLTLKSGRTMVLYIMNPDSVALNDVGITVGITVSTSNLQYFYKETNIEAVH